MTQFASAAFTGTDGTELSALDSNFVKLGVCEDAVVINNRLRWSSVAAVVPRYRHTANPPSADYSVSCDLYVAGVSSTTHTAGPMARCVSGELTGYWARWRNGTGVQLFRYNAGVSTQLGSTVAQTQTAGTTIRLTLKVEGTVVSVYRNAETSTIISVTDGSPITASGFAGLIVTTSSTTDGPHIDNFSADTIEAGGVNVTISNSQQVNTASPGVISQVAINHAVTIASSQQVNTTLAGVISSPIGTDAYIDIPAIRDWETTNLKTGLSGVQVDIRNISTGALIVRKAGQATHATTAVCRVTDPAMPHATLCEVMVRFADGSKGVWDLMSV